MIKHHPTFELLKLFVSGDLPASLSAGVAIHVDMCEKCKHSVSLLTEQLAAADFEEVFLDRFIVDSEVMLMTEDDFDMENMINDITESSEIDVPTVSAAKHVTLNDKTYVLPKALSSMDMSKSIQVGKLTRSRINLDEGEIHSSLLHIDAGGGVPEHTHKGFELTVLLDGSFKDEHDVYVKGDFIMLDAANTHNPISEEGCLCYTVANDALHFTKGVNKLLNPIGSFIY